MKRLVILFLAAILLGVQGCQTNGTRATSTLQVALRGDGKVSVEGRVARVADLASAVKRAGAHSSTAIMVAVPEEASKDDMARVASLLRQTGYVRVVFTRPRRAEVTR